jgi:hypothetical protein
MLVFGCPSPPHHPLPSKQTLPVRLELSAPEQLRLELIRDANAWA